MMAPFFDEFRAALLPKGMARFDMSSDDLRLTVGGSFLVTVGLNHTMSVGANQTLNVGRAATWTVGQALALQTEIDALHVHGREIYWLARKNIAESTGIRVAVAAAAVAEQITPKA